MATFLKHREKDLYIKSVSWVNGTVEFTDDQSEAKRYKGDWFSDAELQQLKHYCDLKPDEGGLAEDYSDAIPYMITYMT